MMGWVDTHAHLQDARFDDDRGAVVERAMDALDWMVLSCEDLATGRAAVALCTDRIFTAVGFHPYHAGEAGDPALSELRALANEPGVVAIGEIGLDYYKYCDQPRDVQAGAFRAQLRLAAELGLPVTIHNRDAHDDCAAILAEFAADLPAVVMHCFGGDAESVEPFLDLGCMVSFAGNVTFPKAEPLRMAAARTPRDRLLVETDSPYLAPQPVRGKRCEPAHAAVTGRCLAEVLGMPEAELAAATTANAARVFRHAKV
jgi:TatD DNase family protein